MKSTFLTLFLSISLLSMPTFAGFYTGAGIGSSFNDGSVIKNNIKSSYKDSPAYSFYAGYQLPLFLTDARIEGEYLRIHPDKKKGGHASMDALMINGYIDVPVIPFIDPYVGIGVGLTRFEHENAPAYQAMLGIDYELPFAPITVGGEYRYFKITENGGARDEIAKMHSNIFMLKFRYEF